MQTTSKGYVDRNKKEAENKAEKSKQQLKQKVTKWNNVAKSEILGTYKKQVIDNFLKVFNENYGDQYDSKSLIDSLQFQMKEDKNGLVPSFSFDESKVKFNSDLNREGRLFNENATNNFIGVNDTINPDLIDYNSFINMDEIDAYQKSSIDFDEINEIENNFIPTAMYERFGLYNRINRLCGYTPKQKSGEIATKQSENTWNKIKTEVIEKTKKKFRM